MSRDDSDARAMGFKSHEEVAAWRAKMRKRDDSGAAVQPQTVNIAQGRNATKPVVAIGQSAAPQPLAARLAQAEADVARLTEAFEKHRAAVETLAQHMDRLMALSQTQAGHISSLAQYVKRLLDASHTHGPDPDAPRVARVVLS